MNSKKKIKGFHLCVGFCLIMMLIFQGNIVSHITVNASDFLRMIETGSILPEEYACSFQITDNTRTETFGLDNTLRDSIDPKGVHAIEVQEIKDSSQKGKTGILYTNAGVYKGKIFDLKITLTDWGEADKDKSPAVCFYTDNLKIGLNAVKKAKFSFGFFKHGTEEEMNIKGHFTLIEEINGTSSTMLFDRGFSVELKARDAESAIFAFTPYKGASKISTDFYQRVGAPGSTWNEAVKTNEQKPYEFCEYETFEYMFRHKLSPNQLKEYEMRSTLDECLAVYGEEDVRVTDAFGENVTARFRIAIDEQTIICKAKENELEKNVFIDGGIYTFHIEVHRKRGAEIEAAHFQQRKDGFTFLIPGTAELSWMTGDGEKKSITSGTAWVQSRMLAELAVEQTSDYECKPGDIVDFTVLVRQTNVNARAVNVQVENLTLPQGLQLIGNATASGAPDVALENKEQGWILSCPELDFDHVIAIVFQCKVAQDTAGQEFLNTVTATADNYLDESGSEGRIARDAQDIWVNAADVTTRSSLNKEIWETGDEVVCRLTVLNSVENTVAVDVEVTEEILPEGLKLTEVDGTAFDKASDVIMYPVSDKKTGLLRKAVDNYWNILTEGNNWKLKIDYLTSQKPLQLELKCTAETDSTDDTTAGDLEISEETVIKEENTGQWLEDENGSAETAQLDLNYTIHNRNLKENDNRLNNEFRAGELVDYKITVENRNPDTRAENLVISNTSLPEGLQLQGGIEAITWEGAEGFVTNEGAGWKLNIEKLPYNTPVTIQYACIVDESINGMEIINTAAALADNAQEVKSSTKIWVNSPELLLSQEPDKNSCKYGETITYRLRLSQLNTGCVSRNAVVEVLAAEGTKLQKKSIKLLDSQEREAACDVQVTGNNFVIRTGKDIVKEDYYAILDAEQGGAVQQSMWNPLNEIEDTELTVEYQVAVMDAALEKSEVTNQVTVNSDENIPKENEETLQVDRPILEIEIKTDKQTYVIGETVFYTLMVTQTGEDTVARDIIVSDGFQLDGVTIVGDSLRIRFNGAVIDAENMEVGQKQFVIHTERNLSEGDKLEISYQVVLDNPQLEGKQLVNRAEVRSSETDAVSAAQKIHIEKKKNDAEDTTEKKQEGDSKKTKDGEKVSAASEGATEPLKAREEKMTESQKKKNATSETETSSKAALFFIIIAGGALTSTSHLFHRFKRLRS